MLLKCLNDGGTVRVTDHEEVVDGAGFVLDPDDTRNIAGAILSLFNQPELAEQLSRQGIAQAATFSWERTARETLGVYEAVLTGKKRTA